MFLVAGYWALNEVDVGTLVFERRRRLHSMNENGMGGCRLIIPTFFLLKLGCVSFRQGAGIGDSGPRSSCFSLAALLVLSTVTEFAVAWSRTARLAEAYCIDKSLTVLGDRQDGC